MLSFGMPTLIETATVEEAAALCSELGLHFLELNTNFPNFQTHNLDPDKLRALAQKYNIYYTIHLNDEMPIADFNIHVAKGNVDAVLDAIDFAGYIGAKKINMHLSEGAHYTMPDRIVQFYEAYEDKYLERIRDFRDACACAAVDEDLLICIENVTPFHEFQKNAIGELLCMECFGLTLDVGHNYCTNFVDEKFILDRAARLEHMHLHDARDGKKDHLALGDGEIDLARYLDIARTRDCSVVLETKTVQALRTSVRWIREKGYLD